MDNTEFQHIEQIGQGAYGVVYKAFWPSFRRWVALKKVPLEVDGEGVPPSALREISLLKEMGHPGVISLLDIQYGLARNELMLVFEFMDQDLRKFLNDRQPQDYLTHAMVQSFMFQLICAMAYIHSYRILHRDLKPENVLVDSHGRLRIADFGLARVFSTPHRRYTNGVITLWYRPPELLLGSESYFAGIDVWSLGCIFSELVTLKTLFRSNTEIEMLFKIFSLLGTPSEASWPGVSSLPNYNDQFPNWPQKNVSMLVPGLSPEGVDLFSQMLVCYPVDRLSCEVAKRHPYFDTVNPTLHHLAEL